MHLLHASVAIAFLSLLSAPRMGAQETVVLSNEVGASASFVEREDGWRWTRLTTPANPDGWEVSDGELKFAAGPETDFIAVGWTRVAGPEGKLVLERDAPLSGLRVRRIFSFGAAAHVLRVETWLRSLDQPKLLNRVGLLTLRLAGETFRLTGNSPASFPVFGERLFAGVEDVCAESRAEGDTVRLWQTPDLSVGTEWQFIATAVVGWQAPRAAAFLPGESRIREAFLQYLDTIRVKPRGINLHSDTWWTLPMPFNERDVLQDIEALRRGFFERTGMFFDTYALDLGWSDPRTFWRIDQRNFPNGLHAINARLAELNCRMGLWVSPSSGYPAGLDNPWLASQGYEMTTLNEEGDQVACFALGGRYQREFTETVVGYAKEYSLGHVIFDGLVHHCDDASHLHATGVGASYSIAAGFKDVMDRLRLANPRIVLEPLSCGYPPSPWWNLHTPFLLGPAGDDVPFGQVPCPDWTESLISARDIVYRASLDQWIVRTQALETFDIILQAPGLFQHMAVMAVGRGRWFVSANIRPELMKPADWDFLAALIRWQRHNERYLTDSRMIGGRPEKREAYGYMFHNADKDLYCIRNPWMEPRTIQLPFRVDEPRALRMIYPRRAVVAELQPDQHTTTLVLGPYETMFLETTTALPEAGVAPAAEEPHAELIAGPAEVSVTPPEDEQPRIDYHWAGALTVPDLKGAELCILIEGAPKVAAASGAVWLNGEPVQVTSSKSAGQFGAAVEASPENWQWLSVPLQPGEQEFALSLTIPLAQAAVAVFVRGGVPVQAGDEAPEGPAFPLYQPDRRPWSQTLQPLKVFGRTGTGEPGS